MKKVSNDGWVINLTFITVAVTFSLAFLYLGWFLEEMIMYTVGCVFLVIAVVLLCSSIFCTRDATYLKRNGMVKYYWAADMIDDTTIIVNGYYNVFLVLQDPDDPEGPTLQSASMRGAKALPLLGCYIPVYILDNEYWADHRHPHPGGGTSEVP